MKLALFSANLSQAHIAKLQTYFDKPLDQVRFLFITTPANYKPYKPAWLYRTEKQWNAIFPLFQEFDIEHALRAQPTFDFESFYNDFDFVFVSGGNLFILSYWMEQSGSNTILRKLIEANRIVYGGESAGAVYAYNDLTEYQPLGNPEKAISINNDGMGIIPFAPIPHWENQEFKAGLEPIKKSLDDKGIKTVTITDDQGCFVENENYTTV